MENNNAIKSRLLGRIRSAVLSTLLLRPEQALHWREIARITAVSPGTLHRELATLEALGIVKRTQTGRQVFFAANRSCPVFEELAGLLRKTAGLADIVSAALAPFVDQIESAFVYGSMAAGATHKNADVDVMIVGTIGFAEAARALAPAQRMLQRETNPTVITAENLLRKWLRKDPFTTKVWSGPKMWLIGSGQ